ncbi:unnamed protein product [Heterosigma akashiwo]|eukprot:CAMPEP_0206390442 /NCGR_PEP_ID=MMETSP0294-20121207/18611_1 /ASSEMBLY_ACC=CAM_ASM_000327 /TAXON_ID=39354 /ORGANISM="Heterosigma akashiwo, Strain CCMP2393" /LENGTH=72 /DNA_ID=CAMNT_0053842821 /DNA_START=36 /DNA_END=254 /DNA_ORIENTATION=-
MNRHDTKRAEIDFQRKTTIAVQGLLMGGVVGASGVAVHTVMNGGSLARCGKQATMAGLFMGTIFAVGSVMRR